MPKQITLKTWSGSRVPMDQMPKVLSGWQSYALRLERQLKRVRNPKMKPQSLEYRLCEVLLPYCGERGTPGGEDAVDTLCRIIAERNQALTVLALKVLNDA